MAIIALKAWYLEKYEPLNELEGRSPDLRLSRNSLLKSALRVDFLNDGSEVRQSSWFQRYLAGEVVEFYIEGSGTYAIANIDLISHEIYFAKHETFANLDPTIFLCYQTEFSESSDILRDELNRAVEDLNGRSRIPLSIEESHRLTDGPTRLTSTLMQKLRKSLVFIADVTPVLSIDSTPVQLIPSPRVCVEVGYALQCKRPEQILTVHMERENMPGIFPFDIPSHQRLQFQTNKQLRKPLSDALANHLQPFNLLT
ncbi:MAG: hypothetical protein AAGA75_07265 [Cyanobacteria bacterium P01_E01_bin.6]